MATNSERVQYELEVITKGQEELRAFRQELADFGKQSERTGDRVKPATEQVEQQYQKVKKTGTESSAAFKEQGFSLEGVTGNLKKAASPLREFGALFSKLNPSVLLASLGLTAVVNTVTNLANTFEKNVQLTAGLAGLINQYTTETIGYHDLLDEMQVQSEALDVPIGDLEEAYRRIVPVARDWGLAQGILNKALEVRGVTRLPLQEIVATLTDAFANGAYVMDNEGGKYLFGAEAIEALALAMKEGGDQALAYGTKVEDTFATLWDDFKRGFSEGAEGAVNEVKLVILTLFDFKDALPLWKERFKQVGEDLADVFKGAWDKALDLVALIPGIDSDQLKADIEAAFSKAGDWIWDVLQAGWDAVVDPGWWGKVAELFNPVTIAGHVKGGFVSAGSWIWGHIKTGWESIVDPSWWGKIGEVFNPATLAGYVKDAFVSAGSWIWGHIQTGWDSIVSPGWWEKVAAVFNPVTIAGHVKDAFVNAAAWIWDHIKSGWEAIVEPGWWGKVLDVFDWKRILSYISLAWNNASKWIWDKIKAGWEGIVDPGWWKKMGEIFSVSEMKGLVTDAFKDVGFWIWGKLKSGLDWVQRQLNKIKLKIPTPSIKMPRIPSFSSIPGVPSVPGITKPVSIPKPSIPSIPSISDIPGVPSIPGVTKPMSVPIWRGIKDALGLEEGGVVTKPTFAMVGEGGEPEGVAPLSKLREMLGGTGVQEVSIYLDGRRLERFVIERFEKRVRLRGAR